MLKLLTKVTKHSKNKLQANKTNLSTIRFCRALDNSKKDVTNYCGVPALILQLSILL